MSATKPFQLHLTEEQLARYKDTAHAWKTNLSALIRTLMDAEAEAVGAGGGEQAAKGGEPAPKKSMFEERKLPEHHEEIMKVLKGLALAEYCRLWRVVNPETGLIPSAPDPVIVDTSESKADRRERELIAQAEERDRLLRTMPPPPPQPEDEEGRGAA